MNLIKNKMETPLKCKNCVVVLQDEKPSAQDVWEFAFKNNASRGDMDDKTKAMILVKLPGRDSLGQRMLGFQNLEVSLR